MASSKVMTIRVEPELLEQLRVEARTQKRSLSGQVIYFVREALAHEPRRAGRPKPTMGWLTHLEVPEDLETFREVRRELSGSLERRVRRYPRRP